MVSRIFAEAWERVAEPRESERDFLDDASWKEDTMHGLRTHLWTNLQETDEVWKVAMARNKAYYYTTHTVSCTTKT